MINRNNNSLHRFGLLAGALLLAALMSSTAVADSASAKKMGDLSRIVVVGDSLSAGFQNFSLYDSQDPLTLGGQTFSFPALIARQAGVTLDIPLISYPGIPAALAITGITPQGEPIVSRQTGNGFRSDPTVQATNLSVPGFAIADVLSRPFPGDPFNNAIDAMSASVLATPGVIPSCGPVPLSSGQLIVSQVACAAALNPGLILVSAGNNDALQSVIFGIPSTDPALFGTLYEQMMSQLSATGAPIVVANIPDVTAIPFLWSAAAFRKRCAFLPAEATEADSLVVNIVDNSRSDFDICSNYVVRPAALVQQAQSAVSAYNSKINSIAGRYKATVVDVNGLFAKIGKSGYDVDGRHLTTQYLGGLFSLDGMHPTITGQAIMANEWIKAINKATKAKIVKVCVGEIAKIDPLVLPNN